MFRAGCQFQICFINYGRRLQSMPVILLRHVALGHFVQFAIHNRHQEVERLVIALAPLEQQLRDIHFRSHF